MEAACRGGLSQVFVVAQRIDVSHYREANLMVRYHEGTIGASATVAVGVAGEGHTAEDPGLTFQTDAASPLATVSECVDRHPELRRLDDVNIEVLARLRFSGDPYPPRFLTSLVCDRWQISGSPPPYFLDMSGPRMGPP